MISQPLLAKVDTIERLFSYLDLRWLIFAAGRRQNSCCMFLKASQVLENRCK